MRGGVDGSFFQETARHRNASRASNRVVVPFFITVFSPFTFSKNLDTLSTNEHEKSYMSSRIFESGNPQNTLELWIGGFNGPFVLD